MHSLMSVGCLVRCGTRDYNGRLSGFHRGNRAYIADEREPLEAGGGILS